MTKVTTILRSVLLLPIVLLTAPAHAQIEGTLFTQPDEREYLDYLREEFLRNNAEAGFDIQEENIPEIPNAEVVQDTGPVEFSFGGIMTRRDGSHSAWLNGQLFTDQELPEGISIVTSGRSASLRIARNGSTFVLLPGQSINLTTGTIMENFQRAQIQAPSVKEDTEESEADTTNADTTDASSSVSSTLPSTANSGPIAEVEAPADERRTANIADVLSQMGTDEVNQLIEVLQLVRGEDEADEEDEP